MNIVICLLLAFGVSTPEALAQKFILQAPKLLQEVMAISVLGVFLNHPSILAQTVPIRGSEDIMVK
jgi:hypothetical protein